MKKEKRKPKEIFESHDPRYEHGYVKLPGQEVEKVTKKSTRNSLRFDDEKLEKILWKSKARDYTLIHNHPFPLSAFSFIIRGYLPRQVGATPSSADLKEFIRQRDCKNFVIIQQHVKTGEEEGRYILRKPKYWFLRDAFSNVDEFLNYDTSRSRYPLKTIREYCESKDLQLKIIPSKGYKLNFRGIFVKEKSGIEQKTETFLISLFFLFSILLLSESITGYTIVETQNSSNMVGIFLLIIAFIALYFLKIKENN